MSDEELRALERRVREHGAPEDEVELLRALVRAGRLDLGRLRLAAYLQHPAALLALEGAPPDTPEPGAPGSTAARLLYARRWSEALGLHAGSEGLARAAIGIALSVLDLSPGLFDHLARRHLGVALACVVRRGPRHVRACRQLVDDRPALEDMPGCELAFAAVRACVADGVDELFHALRTATAAHQALSGVQDPTLARARAAVTRALVPWALGRPDPFLDLAPLEEAHSVERVAALARGLETGRFDPARVRLAGALGHREAAVAAGIPEVLELSEVAAVVGSGADAELWARLLVCVFSFVDEVREADVAELERLIAIGRAPDVLVRLRVRAGEEPGQRFVDMIENLRWVTQEELLSTAQRRVVPWALGEGDPLGR